MKGYVYILKSRQYGKYYVGSTTNFVRRIKEHNSGKVHSTKHWLPYDLIFSQEYESYDKARKIEKRIKSWKRKDFIQQVIEDGKINILE